MKIEYKPIGFVRTPYNTLDGVPNQPHVGKDIAGCIEILPEYKEGLADLDGFSHIILICHFHMSSNCNLKVIPNGETKMRGLFATRSPNRPNPIGLSIVRLQKVEGNKLWIYDLDILNGTPVLDIKPYVGELNKLSDVRSGWNN